MLITSPKPLLIRLVATMWNLVGQYGRDITRKYHVYLTLNENVIAFEVTSRDFKKLNLLWL
jgi:IS1 family transposase